jgi:hypothetical protein
LVVVVEVNVAVTLLLAFIVIDAGLVVPVRSPLQPENVYPLAGVAVSETTVPAVYVLALGLRVIEPEPLVAVVRVYDVVVVPDGANAASE